LRLLHYVTLRSQRRKAEASSQGQMLDIELRKWFHHTV